ERVTAELLEAGLHVPELLDQRLHAIGGRRIGKRVLELAQPRGYFGDRARAVHGRRNDARSLHLSDVLAQVAHRFSAIDDDLADVGLVLPDDHAKDGRFSGPIRTHEAHLLAAKDVTGGVEEEDLPAVLLGDALKTDHGGGVALPTCVRRPRCAITDAA